MKDVHKNTLTRVWIWTLSL